MTSPLRLYTRVARSALRRCPDDAGLPLASVSSAVVRVDRDHLADYARLCGFRISDALPATYPHVLAFPLAMDLMTGRAFPFSVMGLVHVEQHIIMHQPLKVTDRFVLEVHAADLRPHPRSQQFDIVTAVRLDGTEVWTGRSTYLRRSGARVRGTSHRAGVEEPFRHEVSAVWRLPADLGRRYAAVSGDRNPIHLRPLTARPFGYRRPIAHGMWAVASCLAGLAGRMPATSTIHAGFRRPILLPARTSYGLSQDARGWAFELRNFDDGTPHLLGRVEL
ncbi:MAG TPA: MaoC/PaaZ C-terminal domain-containing protein [Jiangellaceae bacterium]|nr:MaoC/PaaZ C-terminal domain-containing protein [Jiangellaceae bacterium]